MYTDMNSPSLDMYLCKYASPRGCICTYMYTDRNSSPIGMYMCNMYIYIHLNVYLYTFKFPLFKDAYIHKQHVCACTFFQCISMYMWFFFSCISIYVWISSFKDRYIHIARMCMHIFWCISIYVWIFFCISMHIYKHVNFLSLKIDTYICVCTFFSHTEFCTCMHILYEMNILC